MVEGCEVMSWWGQSGSLAAGLEKQILVVDHELNYFEGFEDAELMSKSGDN